MGKKYGKAREETGKRVRERESMVLVFYPTNEL